MGTQHHRCARRDDVDVVNEDDAERLKVVDHKLIVNDFVVAVHGRFENSRHPIERLDGFFDTRAETSRGSEHDSVNFHTLKPSK